MASLQSLIIFCFWTLLPIFLLFPCATVPQSTETDTAISTDPSYYYNLCAPNSSSCNNITSLRYPFIPTRFCHHQDMIPTCVKNEYLLLGSRRLPSDSFRVLTNITSNSASSDTFLVAANSLFSCGQISRPNYAVDPSLFSLPENYTYMTHLNCTRPLTTTDKIHPASCLDCGSSSNMCYYMSGFETVPGCDPFYMFPPKEVNVSAVKDLRSFLQHGFKIRYTKPSECQGCEASGGRCGASPQFEFVCFCPSSVHQTNCSDDRAVDLSTWVPPGGESGVSKKLVAAISGSAVAAVLISLGLVASIFIYRVRRRKQEDDDESGRDDEGGEKQMDLKDLVTGMGGPTRYSYSQITKFTSNFSSRLGEGGFGTVYKGTICREEGMRSHEMAVAIKVLKDSKGSEKQFMNEVATVGRIHHNNLVRLVGYCAKGKKRALVYEFLEKGSLEMYIHDANRRSEKQQAKSEEECTPAAAVVERLSPHQLYAIAMETARGILYLHQGCRSRILHCDIKPHNVLLDSNYSAKVADFGLARMIDKDRSHVSLTGGGGTPGYAAPEMWSKSYGPITEKSDVYSYGMVLLEMAGGRKNYDAGVSASSQIYFPEWVFQRAARGELTSGRRGETWTAGVGNEEEEEEDGDMNILTKMCLVGLWCIQHVPSKRPPMSRVIQMLEGKAEIGTPPRPFPEEAGSTWEADTAYFSFSNPTVYLSANSNRNEVDGEDGITAHCG
ncbi:hypothetical protein ACLOJK_016761 [Asimina triloba]